MDAVVRRRRGWMEIFAYRTLRRKELDATANNTKTLERSYIMIHSD
jgi:hypothetical protein